MIPFWFDENVSVMDLTTGELVGDMYEKYSKGEIDKARAWWNTNLAIEGYMPLFMPYFDEATDHYTLFAERMVQRNTTHDLPMRPTVTIEHGTVIIENDSPVSVYLRFPLWPDKLLKCNINFSGLARVDVNVDTEREEGYRYWNGTTYL